MRKKSAKKSGNTPEYCTTPMTIFNPKTKNMAFPKCANSSSSKDCMAIKIKEEFTSANNDLADTNNPPLPARIRAFNNK
jgi:hypothetical protein